MPVSPASYKNTGDVKTRRTKLKKIKAKGLKKLQLIKPIKRSKFKKFEPMKNKFTDGLQARGISRGAR